MTTPATLTDQLVAHAAETLARFDGGELASQFVTEVEAYDPAGVYLTDEGLAVLFAPDARFPGEPFAHAEDAWPRWARHELGPLRRVEMA